MTILMPDQPAEPMVDQPADAHFDSIKPVRDIILPTKGIGGYSSAAIALACCWVNAPEIWTWPLKEVHDDWTG